MGSISVHQFLKKQEKLLYPFPAHNQLLNHLHLSLEMILVPIVQRAYLVFWGPFRHLGLLSLN